MRRPGRNAAARQALAGVVVPLIAYLALRRLLGAGTVALAIATGIPVIWMAGRALVRRRFEPVAAVAVVVYVAVLAIAVMIGGGALALKLRDAVLTGAIGIACLGSLIVRRPLLVLALPLLVRLRARRGERLAVDAAEPRVRRVLAVATGILGVTMTLDCAVQVVLALSLSTSEFLAAAGVARTAIVAAGAVALLLYARGARSDPRVGAH